MPTPRTACRPAAIVGSPTAQNDAKSMRPIVLYVTQLDRSKPCKQVSSGIPVVRQGRAETSPGRSKRIRHSRQCFGDPFFSAPCRPCRSLVVVEPRKWPLPAATNARGGSQIHPNCRKGADSCHSPRSAAGLVPNREKPRWPAARALRTHAHSVRDWSGLNRGDFGSTPRRGERRQFILGPAMPAVPPSELAP